MDIFHGDETVNTLLQHTSVLPIYLPCDIYLKIMIQLISQSCNNSYELHLIPNRCPY